MTRNLRISAVFAIFVLSAVSTFGQTSPYRGTVLDIDEGNARLQVETDNGSTRVTVETDSISTQYHGFGTMIAGKPEIFTGSKGFSNLRLGDRVEVNGTSRAGGVILADSIRLLGRQVAANATGVGQTRTQTSVATPAQERTTTAAPAVRGTIEGTIRQINIDEGRIVIQTPQRRMMTVRTYRNTPVVFRGETFRVTNLEIGDQIRVEPEPRDAQMDEIVARRIEVTRSVQDGDDGRTTGGTVTVIEGTVTRTEPGLDYAYVDEGRGAEIRVDMAEAEDANGARIHARDLRNGDRVEITGSFNRVGDMFLGSTVRFPAGARVDVRDTIAAFTSVTINATVTQTLEDEVTLGLRDRDSNRTLRLWVADDFIVRTKGTTTTTADKLKVNDQVIVKAFRDPDGNLVAQTIRLRNR